MYFAYTWREHVRASKPSFPPMARTGRSVYQQHKSRCLCLRDSCVWHPYQNTNSPARAKKSAAVFSNPLSLLPRETKSWPFIYDLSPFLTARLPRNNKKIKKKPTRTMRTGFLLWLFTSVSVFLTCYECNRLIQVKMTSNVCQQHCLTHTEAAARRCSLLVHPCCLLTSSSLVRNKRVTRCFPSPFSGPWTTPTHTRLCVCLCESMDKTACTTGCAIIGQFVFSNWDASVRLLFYSCLR